jgi:hypothetical protein
MSVGRSGEGLYIDPRKKLCTFSLNVLSILRTFSLEVLSKPLWQWSVSLP